MKILFVISALRNGGAERVLQGVANHFVKYHDVNIVVLEEDEKRYFFDKRVGFIYLDVYKSGFKFNKYIKLRNCFKLQNPDVIISFIDWTNVACAISNLGLSYKLIATEHNENSYLKNIFFKKIRDLSYKFCDALTVLSNSDFKYYSKFVRKCVVIYNPFFGEILKSIDKENIIFSAARLESVKGYEMYFEALDKIDRNLLKKWRILIAGDGSLKDKLKNLALKLNLNIEFLGHVEDISSFYQKAKIFTMSSLSEGLPNVLIESAFYECARLSTQTVGAKEIIKSGFDGILTPVGDADEFAKNLTMLMKNEAMREELVKNSFKSIERFKAENIMQKWENLVEQVVTYGNKKSKNEKT